MRTVSRAPERSIEQIAYGLWWSAVKIVRFGDLPHVRPLTEAVARQAMRLALAAAAEIKASELADDAVLLARNQAQCS